MPPLRKSKRKLMGELLHTRDSPRCQSFSVDVPLPMDGSHILTSTTKRGNQMTSKSGMLPPRKSKKYRGGESAKEVQATQQLTTQETSHVGHDAFEDGATRPDVAMHDIPSSTRASTSLEAAVNQYGSDTIASSPCQPYGASYGTNPVTDWNSRVLQKNVATHLEKTSVNKENALPKRANDKLSCSSLPTQATKSTTPKSLNSKLVSSITAIRNSKRDSKGNKVSHLHAAKKTLEANSLKVSRFVSPKAALTIIDHTTRVEKIGPSSPPMKRKMNEVTGEPLNQRKDDTAAVLMSRLEAFHKQTAPVDVADLRPKLQSMESLQKELELLQRQKAGSEHAALNAKQKGSSGVWGWLARSPGASSDFEPITVPITTTVHSPSRVVVPPHMEEEALLDSIKDIMKDGPVPPGVSLREHTTPPDGHIYSIRFDSIGKPVGPNAGKFSAKCGVYARMGHLFPLDVMWKKQSSAAKDMALKDLSKMFQSTFDLDFSHSALTTIRDRLREWRYKVKKTNYEPYATDEERIANRHPRVEEGQWIRLIALWSTKAKMIESIRNKSNKAKQVITHTLGRQSFSVLRDKMASSGEGDVLFSIAFVQGHKKANGSYHNKETKYLMERITSRAQSTSSSSTSIENSLYDIIRLQEIIRDVTGKEDHGGYCRGLGAGVTRRRLSHPMGTFQTLTQSHINRMREDVNHVREDAKHAREEAEQERMKIARAEANAKAANERFQALEEVQRSTFQMLVDLQRQFGQLQR